MQHLSRFVAFGLLSVACVMAQERFSDRLTADEKAAAGLDHLTPAQLAALDALVKQDSEHRAPAPAALPPSTATYTSEAPAAAAQPARSETPAKRRHFGLPMRDETNAITGVLVDEFHGWSGSTMFRLQDGQVWVQEDKRDQYDAEPRANVRVTISKSMFGGYKLTAEGAPGWVRVRRVQ